MLVLWEVMLGSGVEGEVLGGLLEACEKLDVRLIPGDRSQWRWGRGNRRGPQAQREDGGAGLCLGSKDYKPSGT